MSKVHEDNAGYVGVSYEETQDPFYSYNKLSLPLSESQLSAKQPTEETFTVTVANSKFVIGGVSQASLSLAEGGVYKFDQSDSSNAGHPLRFSYTENGTHSGGQEYMLGVSVNGIPGSAGAYTKIVVPFGLHDLYYYCSVHSGYGGFANVAKDVYKFTTGLPILKTTDAFGKTLGTGNNEDPYAANLVLAIPMNGTNNGTTFTDVSAAIRGTGSAKTISRNGNTKTSTAQSIFYGSSAEFDGTDDNLKLPASADFQFGSGDFTIETWFRPDSTSRMAIYHGSSGTDWSVGIDYSYITQTIAIWASSNGTSWNLADGDSSGNRGTTVVPVGAWTHIAYVRDGGRLRLFVNGNLDKEFSVSGSIVDRSSAQPVIGEWFNSVYDLDGYLADFRIYKGVAKYTTPFTIGSYGMDVVTYSGNGSTQTISGLNFQPDLIWIKSRDGSSDWHTLADSVRGLGTNGAYRRIYTNEAFVEENDAFDVTAINSDGFSLTNGSFANATNETYVAWTFKAGGAPTADNTATAGSTPTAGSAKIDGQNMTSSLAGTIPFTRLSASTKYGFSIVTYEGTGSAGSIDHGLGKQPQWIVIKNRDSATEWLVGHAGIGLGSGRLIFNDNHANSTGGAANYWNSTAPTTSVFSVGGHQIPNELNKSIVAYCWSEIPGYSKFSNYNGNGSTQVITTGFKPAWILFKRIDSNAAGADWYILDSKRISGTQEYLLSPNLNSNETATLADYVVLNDDGFTLQTGTTLNGSGRSYIYAAFAESAPGDAAFESLVVDQLDLKDQSGNSNNASNAGATWQTSVKKFYGGAAEFNGNADENAASRVSVSDGLTFNNDFTIEFWAYPSSLASGNVLFDCWQNQTSGTGFYIWEQSNGAIDIVKDANTYYQQAFMSAGSLSANTWNHIAIVRSGNVVTGYSNGSPRGTYTVSDNWTSTKGMIGSGTGNSTMKGFAGYLQDFKHYGGIAKYTSSFTPPERSVQGTARRYPSGIYVVS